MKFALIENGIVKQIQPNAQVGFIEVPDSTVAGQIDNGDGTYISPPLTQEELDAQAQKQAKINRELAVEAITVTTTAGNTFDGDEKSQSRMERSITSLTSGFNGTTKHWKLADNSIVVVDANELKEALTLASLAQDAIWLQ